MPLLDNIKARMLPDDPNRMRRVFTPQHMVDDAPRGAVLGTFLQDATNPTAVRAREWFLGTAERFNLIEDGARAAAGAPGAAGAVADAASVARAAGRVGRDAAAPIAPNLAFAGAPQLATPTYGGLLAQHVAQERAMMFGVGMSPVYSFADPQAAAAYAEAAAAAQLADGIAPVVAEVAPVADEAGAALDDAAKAAAAAAAPMADDAATRTAQMEAFLVEAFEQLAQADEATKLKVLSGAVDARALQHGSESVAELLARSLVEAPLEQSTEALKTSIGKLAAEAAADAAKVADDAAKVADGAAKVAAAAAPVADDTAKLASAAAPLVDDAAKVVSKVAPAADDAARAARAVVAGGSGRLMSMTSAIAEALRVLPKI